MDLYQYNQYSIGLNDIVNDKNKLNDLKNKLKVLQNINDLKSAKDAIDAILPLDEENSTFYIGNAKCTVTNRSDRLVVCIDSDEEFVCYSFD